nr:DegT/DnrJ/EryC1/StrS family aminotransferase [Clostridia bacterium]
MANKEEVVMNGAGIAEIGFPMWPQFNPDSLKDIQEPLINGKVNYWTGKKGMEFEEVFAKF